MKKLIGGGLIFLGAVLISISILALIQAFDTMQKMQLGMEDFAYLFGSVLIPLLITVIGRWLYRRGKNKWKS
jgi:hypothetical protein